MRWSTSFLARSLSLSSSLKKLLTKVSNKSRLHIACGLPPNTPHTSLVYIYRSRWRFRRREKDPRIHEPLLATVPQVRPPLHRCAAPNDFPLITPLPAYLHRLPSSSPPLSSRSRLPSDSQTVRRSTLFTVDPSFFLPCGTARS